MPEGPWPGGDRRLSERAPCPRAAPVFATGPALVRDDGRLAIGTRAGPDSAAGAVLSVRDLVGQARAAADSVSSRKQDGGIENEAHVFCRVPLGGGSAARIRSGRQRRRTI